MDGDRTRLDPATQASVDQWQMTVRNTVNTIADHWEVCPGDRVCLGATAMDIGEACETGHAANVGMALQAALHALATIEYDRRHGVEKVETRPEPGAFASCPAATGEVPDRHDQACTVFPDNAHRCGKRRDGHGADAMHPHTCVCTYRWYVTGSRPLVRGHDVKRDS